MRILHAMQTSSSVKGKSPAPHPWYPGFVTASPEEIRHAEELRRQLEQRYLARRDLPDPHWCVGIE